MFLYSAFADEISPDLEEQIRVLKSHGMRYIEARGINGKNISDYTVPEIREVKKRLDADDMKISALGSPIGKIKITDPFEPELDKFKNTLELAAELGTDYIRMFSFFMDTSRAEEYRGRVLERWEKYLEAANGYPVTLLHENEKGIYGDTAQRCLDLVTAFNSSRLRVTFDPANFVQCGEDTLRAFELLRPYIAYMHIKDAKNINGEVVPAGYGDGNVAEILNRLNAEGWNGFLSLEPHLADFVGFSDLEEHAEKKEKLSGAETFDIAYRALMKLV